MASLNTCKSCYFFRPIRPDQYALGKQEANGGCFRYPPIPQLIGIDPQTHQPATTTVYPIVSENTPACGEYDEYCPTHVESIH